jgi:hypothetical protein
MSKIISLSRIQLFATVGASLPKPTGTFRKRLECIFSLRLKSFATIWFLNCEWTFTGLHYHLTDRTIKTVRLPEN